MKHLILIIILAMHGLCLNGKDISIEFSVEMEDKDAYLIITYHNNGTTDYYLPSLFYNDTQYAEFFPRYCNSFKPYRSSRTENIERLGEFRGAEYNLTFRFIDRNIRTELNLEPLRDSCIDYLNAEVAAYYDFMGVNNKKVFEILRNEDYVKHSPFFVFVKSLCVRKILANCKNKKMYS